VTGRINPITADARQSGRMELVWNFCLSTISSENRYPLFGIML
jgi:hypothetical protein